MLLGTTPAIVVSMASASIATYTCHLLATLISGEAPNFYVGFSLFVHRRVHVSCSSQMTPVDSSALHWKALITAILTVVTLVATTTTKASQVSNSQTDRLVPSIQLELIQAVAPIFSQ